MNYQERSDARWAEQAMSERDKYLGEMAAQNKALAWLASKGLDRKQGEGQTGYMQRLAGFRERLKRIPRPDKRAWARDVIQRNEDGEMVSLFALVLAREAVESAEAE